MREDSISRLFIAKVALKPQRYLRWYYLCLILTPTGGNNFLALMLIETRFLYAEVEGVCYCMSMANTAHDVVVLPVSLADSMLGLDSCPCGDGRLGFIFA
ncbi:MAG: hypothetical protein ACFFCW_36425, partial [Candidatus Hodarchaeota archaeon]